jgi:hypothetical protein
LPHAEVDASLEVHKRVIAPEAALNLFSGHDLSGPFCKQQEDAEGLGMYLERESGFAQLTACGAQFECAETYHRGRMGR